MSTYKNIFDTNIGRVESLNALYSKLKDDNQADSKDYKLTDILRSSIVFLHSAFEEYFRNILIEWLPIKANDETLKSIPISTNVGKKPEKLFLSDLAHYRDKTVNELIKISVAETLKQKSFNSEGDIRAWCSKIGINLDDFHGIKDIDKAVQRRHKIVHEADMDKMNGSKEKLTLIYPGMITPWKEAYISLVELIDKQVSQWEEEINVPTDFR